MGLFDRPFHGGGRRSFVAVGLALCFGWWAFLTGGPKMGLFDRLLRGGRRKMLYPTDLQPQIDKAMAGLRALTAAHDGVFRISQADWSVDQDEGAITFTSPNGMIAKAPVQIVGSYNTRDGTWLWGWDNPSLEDSLTEHARKVQSYGREHGYEVLTTPMLTCPEEQCWELTALACMLAEAQGAYSGPAGEVRVFMTFGGPFKLSKAS